MQLLCRLRWGEKMKILVGNEKGSYVFNHLTKTISMSGLNPISLEQILLITNTTSNIIMYSFADDTLKATISANVITLVGCDTSTMNDTDRLQIFVDVPALAYDPIDDMTKIKSMQKKFRDSFGGSAVDLNKWVSLVETGVQTISGGLLTMGSGTTINKVNQLVGKETFTVPFRISFNLTLSQRIANQSFYIEAISVDPATLEPNNLHSCGFIFDGTNAAQAKYSVQNNGVTPLVSATTTFPTTVSAGLYEIESFCDEVWFHGKTMDATAGRTNSQVRHQQIPDPNSLYKIRIRWLNGGSAPASNTNAILQFVACQDYAELTAEITAGRGQSVAGQGLGVFLTGGLATATQPVSGTVTANQGTLTTPTASNVTSATSTNATIIKASAGTIYSITANNIGSVVRYIKIYNLATSPVVGTTVPILTITLPPTSEKNISFGALGHRLSAGIGMAITSGALDTDATNAVAGEVKVCTSFI